MEMVQQMIDSKVKFEIAAQVKKLEKKLQKQQGTPKEGAEGVTSPITTPSADGGLIEELRSLCEKSNDKIKLFELNLKRNGQILMNVEENQAQVQGQISAFKAEFEKIKEF